MSSSTGTPTDTKPARLVSLDAYRGFIMLTMASGGFAFAGVARQPPFQDSSLWKFLAYQFEHVPWAGCAFWDLIQPSFMFMVGVAIPYSHASRLAKGESAALIARHVLVRSALLVLLGVLLSSNHAKETNWTFVNVLTQIGLGYALVYVFLGRGLTLQLLALAGSLIGYGWYFAGAPLPPENFDYARVGVDAAWLEQHGFSGWFAHWNKNSNAAAAFDLWFLNLFRRSQPFVFNSGGYQTLNFVPSLATMLFGLMAGELLRGSRTPTAKCNRLIGAGAACLVLGMILDRTVCPSVKRIWTPSWAVFSTGWTFWMLAGFYWLIDLKGWKAWAFPFVVVGMNSIAVYCMAQLLRPWVRDTLKTHLGPDVFKGRYFGHELFAPVFAPIAESTAFLGVLVLISWWMYRQKIFVKI